MWFSVCLGVRGPRRLFSRCRGYSFSPRHVSLFLVYFSTNDSNTFGHPSPFCFHTFSLCLVFLFTSFFSSLFLCEPRGFSFWPFFLPPSMFSVLISNSFRSTPISFLRPLAVHFVQFRVVILPVLKFLFALTDHVFLCTQFGPSCSYSVFIPQCYLLFATL